MVHYKPFNRHCPSLPFPHFSIWCTGEDFKIFYLGEILVKHQESRHCTNWISFKVCLLSMDAMRNLFSNSLNVLKSIKKSNFVVTFLVHLEILFRWLKWERVYIPLFGQTLHWGHVWRSVYYTLPHILVLRHSLF